MKEVTIQRAICGGTVPPKKLQIEKYRRGVGEKDIEKGFAAALC